VDGSEIVMTWTYEQFSGKLYDPAGNLVGVGYSGAGDHKNQPAAQGRKDEGPIPCGQYSIGKVREKTPLHGPYVLPLNPNPDNEMFGRDGFLIHGDSVVHPGTASEGCIILDRDIRDKVGASKDKQLIVVTGLPQDETREA
jgi:hypothetical protein